MSEWVLQAVWRATLLLGGVVVVWRWLPAADPRLRRGTILVVSVVLLAAPWWVGSWQLNAWHPEEGGASPGAGSGPWIGAAAGGLWGVGSAVCLVRWQCQLMRLRRLLRRARPMAEERAIPSDGVPLAVGGKPAAAIVSVRASDEISGPCVAGLWRPVLLVPAQARDWSEDQWRMMLAHEAQHVRQGDLLAGWLPRVVQAVYWWHPLAHWLVRQFHLESEALCDQAVVATRRNPRPYVEFLLSLDGGRLPRLAVPMARKPSLSRRIERLLEAPRHRAGPLAIAGALALLAGVAGVVLSVGTRPRTVEAPGLTEDRSNDTAVRLSASPFPGSGE